MENELKKTFSKVLGIKEKLIKLNTSPRNTKKWDSLAHMNLIMALEKQFKIQFTDQEITEMLNFQLVLRIIKDKQK